jgi:hypothetical protein
MLRQQHAEKPSSAEPTRTVGTDQPRHTARRRVVASRRVVVPRRAVVPRRVVVAVVERALGERWAPTPGRGVLVLLAIAALLGVIALTLSVGNALLVLFVAVVMRVACEYRNPTG